MTALPVPNSQDATSNIWFPRRWNTQNAQYPGLVRSTVKFPISMYKTVMFIAKFPTVCYQGSYRAECLNTLAVQPMNQGMIQNLKHLCTGHAHVAAWCSAQKSLALYRLGSWTCGRRQHKDTSQQFSPCGLCTRRRDCPLSWIGWQHVRSTSSLGRCVQRPSRCCHFNPSQDNNLCGICRCWQGSQKIVRDSTGHI